jgi:hypothetical protein
MLTIFSIPKPFQGHNGIIQRNAINSWRKISESTEIILCGNESGTAEVCTESGLIHFPRITRNKFGTPYLDDVFENVQQFAQNSLIMYVNADIVFLPGLINAIQQVKFSKFLLCGQRIDIDISYMIDFDQFDWVDMLIEVTTQKGKLFHHGGLDYFIFPKGLFIEIPKFVVGRPRWDNWMIYFARLRDIPVIDGTELIKAIHQNHDYSHVKEKSGEKWEGSEGDENMRLAGGKEHLFDLIDSTHKLTNKGMQRQLSDPHLQQRIYRQKVLVEKRGDSSFIRQKMFWFIQVRLRFLPERIWRNLIYLLAY